MCSLYLVHFISALVVSSCIPKLFTNMPTISNLHLFLVLVDGCTTEHPSLDHVKITQYIVGYHGKYSHYATALASREKSMQATQELISLARLFHSHSPSDPTQRPQLPFSTLYSIVLENKLKDVFKKHVCIARGLA
jgi:hypothetical protein